MAQAKLPLLWHFPISHFNEKVRWALDYKGIKHRRRALGVMYGARAWFATRQTKLPILFLDGRATADSTRIIAALEHYRPQPPLYPRNIQERRRALELEEFFDEKLGHAVRSIIIGPSFEAQPFATIRVLSTGMRARNRILMQIFFPLFRRYYLKQHNINEETVRHGFDQVSAALDRLRAELRPSGYLAGDQFSVADLTAAALLSPLVGPPELEYAPSEPLPRHFERVREELAGDPMCRWVRDIYQYHRGHSAEV